MRIVPVTSKFLSIVLLVALYVPLTFAEDAVDSARPKGPKTSSPLSDFELGKYQYCGSDADCVVANNGCCDCANGGQDVAVNKDRLESFKERFDCLQVMCTMMAPLQPCGSGVVSCINHKCKYIEGDEAKF